MIANSTISNQLELFYWEGLDNNGMVHKGHTFADSSGKITLQLDRNQIVVTKLIKLRFPKLRSLVSPVSRNDITQFANQLATLLDAGVSVDHGIKLIEQVTAKYSAKLLLFKIHSKVLSGLALSDAMRLSDPSFDHFFIQMVATGEQSGRLSEALHVVNLYRDKQQAMRTKLTKAMMYPLTVIFAALVVCYIMLSQVIPQFESMFEQFNAPLPAITLTLISASNWVREHSSLVLLLAILILFCILLMYRHSPTIRLFLHQLILKLPAIGAIVLKSSSIQIARVLVICCQSGIPVLSGIQLSEQLIGNHHICGKLQNIGRAVSDGCSIYRAMVAEKIFPALLLQMVMIGEESGRLDQTLVHLIQHYEQDIDYFVDNFHQILEPILVVSLGCIIGGILLAMYLPIFNLLTVLG